MQGVYSGYTSIEFTPASDNNKKTNLFSLQRESQTKKSQFSFTHWLPNERSVFVSLDKKPIRKTNHISFKMFKCSEMLLQLYPHKIEVLKGTSWLNVCTTLAPRTIHFLRRMELKLGGRKSEGAIESCARMKVVESTAVLSPLSLQVQCRLAWLGL